MTARRWVSPAWWVGLGTLGILSRLSLPTALLLFSRGNTDGAIVGTVIATGASLARSYCAGLVGETTLRAAWLELVRAIDAQSITQLRARQVADRGGVRMFGAVKEMAEFCASTLPLAASQAVSLAITVIAAWWLFGGAWIALGALALTPALALVVFSVRKIHAVQTGTWEAYGQATESIELLLQGATEVRAHGRSADTVARLHEHILRIARSERRVAELSMLTGAIPGMVAALGILGPAKQGLAWVNQTLAGRGMLEIGLVGGTAVAIAFGLSQTLEAAARGKPLRDAYIETVSPIMQSAVASDAPTPGALAEPLGEIVFQGLSCRYPDAVSATPHALTFQWRVGASIALTGANGSGKSTALLALLGLVPYSGQLLCEGKPWSASHAATLRSMAVYVPQTPFVLPGVSVRRHMNLFSALPLPDAQLESGLRRLGLWNVLEEHAARRQMSPLDIPASELSGGERQRMHLARALVQPAQFVLLDEPEAALDSATRSDLKALLVEMSKTKRIFLVAHDTSIIPDDWERVACERGAAL